MRTSVKLIWSIVVFVIGLFLAILCQASISQSGKVSMIPGLILVASIFGIIAIWRKKPKNDDEQDKHTLKKD
ncbi:hypothetical protein FACS1894179_02980 [Bacteroidia bacterium]|nr:hypothetical protein FACS1894179_02980 [Bacteroidia bacterium]